MAIVNRTKGTKVYKGKNGYTSTFTKVKVNEGTK